MRNDDPEYVRDLERSVRSIECEIKVLEVELSESRRLNVELNNMLNPTHMGDPVLPAGMPTFKEFRARVEAAEGERK